MTPIFGELLPLLSADPLKLCQVGWGVSLHIYFHLQRCSIRFKSGLWLGHSRTLRLVLKRLLCCLGCVLRVIVLLEGEPSPQSEVLSALEKVFIKDLSVLCSVRLSLDSLPVPAAEKHPHSMMLAPPCFTIGMVPGFLQT